MEETVDKIRGAIRVELARRNMRRSVFAERCGLSRQHVSDVLNGRAGQVSPSLLKMLSELGLELTVKEKGE